MNCSNCGAAMTLVASRAYFQCGHCGTYHFPDPIAADGVRAVGQLPDALARDHPRAKADGGPSGTSFATG